MHASTKPVRRYTSRYASLEPVPQLNSGCGSTPAHTDDAGGDVTTVGAPTAAAAAASPVDSGAVVTGTRRERGGALATVDTTPAIAVASTVSPLQCAASPPFPCVPPITCTPSLSSSVVHRVASRGSAAASRCVACRHRHPTHTASHVWPSAELGVLMQTRS
jgi:hypothetical protein